MAARSPSSFHEQLRILQSDISSLSSKLHIPGPTSSAGPSSPSGDEFLNLRDRYSNNSKNSPWRTGASSSPGDDAGAKKLLNRYKAELQAAVRERDDALNRLDLAHKEMEEMRRGLHQAARLRAAHDHLVQDHEAVKISLESSERIRKQQKALIDLLQRTSHMTHGSSLNGDSASVQSYNSYGGQSASTTQTGNSVYTPVSYSQALAAENKEWLNSSPARFKGNDPNWQPPKDPTRTKVRRPKTSASTSGSVASTPSRLVRTPVRKSSTTTTTTTTAAATTNSSRSSGSASRQQKASSQRLARGGSAPSSPATISSRASSNAGRGGPVDVVMQQRAGRPPRPTSAKTLKPVPNGIAGRPSSAPHR